MTTQFCPFKMAAHALEAPVMTTLTWYCEEEDCGWWNTHFGMCCAAVDAHLKAEAHQHTPAAGTNQWPQAIVVDLDDRRLLEKEE